MEINIVQPIFEAIDAGLNGTLATGTAKFMGIMGIVVGAFWLIYMLLETLYWYFNGLTQAIQEIATQAFKAIFITFFAVGLQPYLTVVVPVVTNAPGELTQVLTGAKTVSTNQVDTLITAFINTAIKVFNAFELDIFNLNATFAGIMCFLLLVICGSTFLATCVATLIVLKISTTIFLAIGPLFILLALFPQTRQYFWGWVNLIGGFMLTNLLFGVVITLEINYINSNIIGSDGMVKASWVNILSMPLIFGALTVIAQELPNFAASIMGGTPVGNGGGVRGMMGSNMTGINSALNARKAMKKQMGKLRKKIGNNIS
jgi:type IV secretion system protein VirB6